jgi:hypothetical protein
MKTRSLLNITLTFPPCALALLALPALLSPAHAGQYNVGHGFTLRPKGNVVPQVQAVYYAHAWGRTFGPNCADSDVKPPIQPPGWGAFGTDRLASQAVVRNRDGGSSIPANVARVNVGAAGLGLTTWTANAPGCASATAQANSEISVNAFAAGTPVTGTLRSFGFANAVAPPPRRSESYAFSMAMVEARGGKLMKNGNIRWGKVVRDVVSGHAAARRQVDPIEFTVTDVVTGETRAGTLFTVTVDLPASSAGGFVWENHQVEITASNLTFHVAFPSTNSSLQGELLVEVAGGVVTNATATGHYAGQAPAVGAAIPFNLAVPNDIEFDYDLGDFGDHDLEVGLDFSGAGETAAEAVSEQPWLTTTAPDDTTLTVEYFATDRPYVLESAPHLSPSALWSRVPVAPVLVEGRVIYHLPRNPSVPSQFFRLRSEQTADTQPPTFQALPQCGGPVVVVEFNEPVQPASALDPTHYQLMALPPATLQIMQVQMISPQKVMLMLNQPLLPGSSYQLHVQGLSDLAGNVVPPGSMTTFNCPR